MMWLCGVFKNQAIITQRSVHETGDTPELFFIIEL